MTQTILYIFSKIYSYLFHVSFEYEGIPLKEMKKLGKKFKQI